MPDWTLPREGGCRCGALRFELTAPPLLTMACHCTGCQRMTASAFSLSVAIPSEGFRVTKGETVLGGLKKPELHHHFCPECLSWAFTRFDGADWFVNVRATLLDDTSGLEPFAESWTAEKLPWVTTPARHSYEGFPPLDAFPALIEEYVGRG